MMKEKLKKLARPALFTAGGAAAGYLYHHFAGCASGTCSIASDPVNSMIYMGIVGWLLSIVFRKEDHGPCSMR